MTKGELGQIPLSANRDKGKRTRFRRSLFGPGKSEKVNRSPEEVFTVKRRESQKTGSGVNVRSRKHHHKGHKKKRHPADQVIQGRTALGS